MNTPNIGPAGIRRRFLFGMVGFALGVAVVAALTWSGAARAWRLTAFPLFWLAGLGWLQAREKT